jgi:hypothetical protein
VGIVLIHEERVYEFKNLDRATCYYVMVTADNDLGEGYKAQPLMIRTMSQDLDTEVYTPYVWGNNANSEIGLSDD